MRKARVYVDNIEAGLLIENKADSSYSFKYNEDYQGSPVSLTLPLEQRVYYFSSFPPFFDGLLPEGYQLEGLLKTGKIDRNDMFSQLMAVGGDMVGNVTVKEVSE